MYLSQEKTKEMSQNSHILKTVNFQWLLGFLFLDGCIQFKFWLQNANLHHIPRLWKKYFSHFLYENKIFDTKKYYGRPASIFLTLCQFIYIGQNNNSLGGHTNWSKKLFFSSPYKSYLFWEVFLYWNQQHQLVPPATLW